MNDAYWMNVAYEEAQRAAERGEIPVGAALVKGELLLSQAGNARSQSNDPLGHAELQAIVKASQRLGDWRLSGTTLYVTMEPCPMCAGLILQTRIERLVFGVPSFREGCAGSVLNLLDYPGMAHHVLVSGGIEEKKISELMKEFFFASRK